MGCVLNLNEKNQLPKSMENLLNLVGKLRRKTNLIASMKNLPKPIKKNKNKPFYQWWQGTEALYSCATTL